MESTSVHNIPLEIMATNGNKGATYINEQVAGDSTDGPTTRNNASETRELIQKTGASNGDTGVKDNTEKRTTNPKKSAICEVKKQLNQKVYKKIPLWGVLLILFALIIAVIFISLVLCSVIHEDEDEKFDPSLFVVPRYLWGSFQLRTWNLIIRNLQNKLDDLYRTSPALGRYFNNSIIYELRNGSVTAQYNLTFLMPADEADQLKRFTLSREMVYNVFRQFLYDQDTSDPDYIDPASLTMMT